MNIHIASQAWADVDADWLVVGVGALSNGSGSATGTWSGQLAELDERLGGQLTRLREAEDLTGKPAEALAIPDAAGIAAKRLLLVGLGPLGELGVAQLDKAMMTAARLLSEKKKDLRVAVALPQNVGDSLCESPSARGASGPHSTLTDTDSLSAATTAEVTAAAFTVGCVGQGLFQKEPTRFPFASVTILPPSAGETAALQGAVERGRILGEAVNLTRELVNRPPDEIYPESFADRAQQLASTYGLQCEVFDERRLKHERMGSLLAVAAGSDRPPRMVVLHYRGGKDGGPTLGLCGKGVTFDSGGLSLKSNDNMKTMKGDMAGAATVLGAMTAIAQLKLPVNVAGFMGLVENMPGGKSYKLGDVLTARNGVTIEVLNTDAEGRLVLADVLSYAVDSGAEKLIDLATLTGSCVVALGEDVTGAFTNNQPWCDALLAAAKSCGEDVWQLPMFEFYSELLKSDVADCKNVGNRWGGAITAAKFLEKFVGGVPWVHLDIAGPSFASSSKPHREGGGTGCMLRTLVEVAATFPQTP